MEVRRARPEDVEQMLDHFEAVAAEGRWISAEPPIDRQWLARRWRERMDEADQFLLVAVAEGRVIGFLGAGGRGPTEFGVSVDKEWRRKGAGSALVNELIEWARSVGSHKLTLQVWPHNEAAIKLYERFGFEREGYLRKQWRRSNGELWDAVVMGLILDDSLRPPRPTRRPAGAEHAEPTL